MTLTAVSLFAGVGGFDLALARTGVHVVAAVEIDPAARGVLADRFPNMTLFDDVTKVTGDQLCAAGFVPDRGVLTAGWPCQGNSVAGRRGGMDDPRSGLWSHVVRLLAETRAAWFIGENVPGLLSVNHGRDFAVVLEDLAGLGMGMCWRVLDAQHFGVPQRRARVFVVGHLGDETGPVQILLEPESGGRDSAASSATRPRVATAAAESAPTPGWLVASTLQGGGVADIGSTPSRRRAGTSSRSVVAALTSNGVGTCGADDNQAQAGHLLAFVKAQKAHDVDDCERWEQTDTLGTLDAGGHTARTATAILGEVTHALTSAGIDAQASDRLFPTIKAQTATATAVRRLTPLECERLQGFPDDWTATSNGKAQADSARYRQMGNAVAVPVVEWIARRLVAVDGAA